MTMHSTRSSANPSSQLRNGSLRLSQPRRTRKPIRTSPPLDLTSLKLDYDPKLEVPKRKRPLGLQDAPTYWPNEKEWTDPLAYIQSIAEEGKKYGIIKVIPPKGWRPQFSVDTERFFFRTRKQELNSMEGATRSNLSYLDKLAKFHRQQGATLSRLPILDSKPIDLYSLKKSVDLRGGYKVVCSSKKWAEVGREMGYGNIKNVTSVSTTLKKAFEKYLLPYENYLERAKPEFLREMGLTPSPQQERKERKESEGSLRSTSPGVKRNLMDELQKTETDERDEQKQVKTTEDVKVESPPATATISEDVEMRDASPSPQSGLKRSFEETVTSTGSVSTENDGDTEPTRRESKRLKKGTSLLRKAVMKAAAAPTVVGSNMAQHAHSKPSRLGVVNGSPSKKPGENCEICGRGDNALSMLLCDGCDTGYHTFCLDPPLKSIPKYDWYCTECLVGTNEFGFEDGEEYSLSQFRQMADSFRDEYLKTKFKGRKNMDNYLDVAEEEVEEEFWRMVSNVNETVEVDYGADIHSTTHGSAFPTVETNPTDPYSTDPWNLNILPLDNQSLFRHIKSDVSGMTVPWLYVGMMFSTFCWHNEDHYCYSINYQHFGATKTWYGIPGSDAEKFEAAMRNAVPELFETQPDLLFQLVTMLSPERLVEEGVKVYAVDQRPNQFVITFPQAYHAGFNHGFNMNEAVNFAPSDWEEYGRACIQRYSEYKKAPVFSHDELLITAALHDSSIKTAKWLTNAMDILVDRELQSRQRSRDLLPELEETVISEDLPSDDQYQCSVCKTYIYLSQITCPCTSSSVCPSHVSELCDCPLTSRVLRLRYTDTDLTDLATKIYDRSRIPEIWTQKFNALMAEYERPPLKNLRSLLSEAERIPYPIPELPSLKAFVDKANEWVEEATAFVARKHQNRRKNEKAWRSGSKVSELEERDKNHRSPDYVYDLLDQADVLGFEVPEIDALREKAEAIEEFQERSQKALDQGTLSTVEEYMELIDDGKALNVDLAVLDTLETIVEQLKWVQKATDLGDVYLTLYEVQDVIDEGQRCGIALDHELMRQFVARRERGLQWEKAASDYLSNETVALETLEKLLDDAVDLSIRRDTYERIESIIARSQEALQQVRYIMPKSNIEGLANRPPLVEARKLLKIVEELPIKPNDTILFRKMFHRVDEWLKRGKRLFGKTNASVSQLEDHLFFVLKRCEAVFDLNDVPKRSELPSPTAEGKDSEDGPYCICRSGPTGEMVECDKCKEWYHMKCLKINRKKFDHTEGWDCPICDWHKEIPRTAARPSLTELKEWSEQAETLPFRPDEVTIVNRIIALAETWIGSIRPILLGLQSPSLDACRLYLRKMEGAEVFLPTEYNFFRKTAHAIAPISATPPPLVSERSTGSKKPKERIKKPKMETVMAQKAFEDKPRLSLYARHDPHVEQRILPARNYFLMSDFPPATSYEPSYPYPHPQRQEPVAPPPTVSPRLQHQPIKGTFPPPSLLPPLPGMEPRQAAPPPPPPSQLAPTSICATCKRAFGTAGHNQPITCTQCQKLHHTLCIATEGRIYPAMVCGECVKTRPSAFQTLSHLTSKKPQIPAWQGIQPRSQGLSTSPRPANALPPMKQPVTVIDLTRSPTPEVRPGSVNPPTPFQRTPSLLSEPPQARDKFSPVVPNLSQNTSNSENTGKHA